MTARYRKGVLQSLLIRRDGMDRLWAPWRMEYITNADRVEGCIFCTKSMEDHDAENYLLSRGKKVFLMLNAFPYSNGHLMVAPYQHTANLDDLDDEAMMEWMLMTRIDFSGS